MLSRWLNTDFLIINAANIKSKLKASSEQYKFSVHCDRNDSLVNTRFMDFFDFFNVNKGIDTTDIDELKEKVDQLTFRYVRNPEMFKASSEAQKSLKLKHFLKYKCFIFKRKFFTLNTNVSTLNANISSLNINCLLEV